MGGNRKIEIAKFDELDDSWVQTGQVWTRFIFIGPGHKPDSPVGVAITAGPDVGDFIAGRRSFPTTNVLTVLSGQLQHDGRWMSRGDIYSSPPGEVAGDLLFGPDGAVIFIMFNRRSGIIPTFADPTDQANFDRYHRKDVEEVAAGKVERSVPILPLRTFTTPARAIVCNTVAEVEEYRKKAGPEW